MMRPPLFKEIDFEPVIEDNHILYYQKGVYKVYDEKYKFVDGSIELYMQIIKEEEVIYEGIPLSMEDIDKRTKE